LGGQRDEKDSRPTHGSSSLSWAVKEMKRTADQLVAQVPSLDNDKIVDLHIELYARELNLEQTTATRDDI
jgi:hypothetical protein